MRVRRAPNYRFNPNFSFVQAFLSEKALDNPGKSVLVFEVYINKHTGNLVCTCFGFQACLKCIHIDEISKNGDEGGVYLSLDPNLEVTDEIKMAINHDPDVAFYYLSNFGKVKVVGEG